MAWRQLGQLEVINSTLSNELLTHRSFFSHLGHNKRLSLLDRVLVELLLLLIIVILLCGLLRVREKRSLRERHIVEHHHLVVDPVTLKVVAK